MKQVAASEFDLLSIARALVSDDAGVEWLLLRKREMPKELSPQAISLIQDLLSRGVLHTLCRTGGWQKTRTLQGDKILSGRLWERHPDFALTFTDFSIKLLTWMTAEELTSPGKLGAKPKSCGDELLAFLALGLAKEAGCGAPVAKDKAFQSSALCWLAYPDLLGLHASAKPRGLRFDNWVSGTEAMILEALAPSLKALWLQMEQAKGWVIELDRMAKIGQAQAWVLEEFTKTAAEAQRHDLCFFLLRAAAELAKENTQASDYTTRLEAHKTMAQRSDAMTAAAAYLDGLSPFPQWVQAHRSLRFFDDEYEAAQLLLEEWDALGDLGYGQLQTLAADLRSFTALENKE